MPHHSADDLATIFDPDFGEGWLATISPQTGGTYEVNVMISKEFEQVDEMNNVQEKVTVLEFITSTLAAALQREDQVTAGGRTWIIERMIDQDTYISRYAVT